VSTPVPPWAFFSKPLAHFSHLEHFPLFPSLRVFSYSGDLVDFPNLPRCEFLRRLCTAALFWLGLPLAFSRVPIYEMECTRSAFPFCSSRLTLPFSFFTASTEFSGSEFFQSHTRSFSPSWVQDSPLPLSLEQQNRRRPADYIALFLWHLSGFVSPF